jgi:hypothetical protein
MKKASAVLTKVTKIANAKRATRRPFPYERVASLWAKGKSIPQIAEAIDRVGQGEDPYHGLRVVLTRMHKGYKDKNGNIVKLPHRVSRKTLRHATEAGKKSSA